MHPYSLELFIPWREKKHTIAPSVPFLSTKPHDDWGWDEGEMLWIVNGVTFVNRDAGLYPLDQLTAALDLLTLALTHKPGVVNIGGSIIELSTAPIDANRARFIYNVEERHIRGKLFNHAEHREVDAHIRRTTESVLHTINAMSTHLASFAPPLPPHLPPRRPIFDEFGDQLGVKFEAVTNALAAHNSRHRRHAK